MMLNMGLRKQHKKEAVSVIGLFTMFILSITCFLTVSASSVSAAPILQIKPIKNIRPLLGLSPETIGNGLSNAAGVGAVVRRELET